MPSTYHVLRKAGPDGRTPLSGSGLLLRALVIKCGLEREHLQTAALLVIGLEEFIREQRRSTSMEPQELWERIRTFTIGVPYVLRAREVAAQAEANRALCLD
jgi:hypothetical protein